MGDKTLSAIARDAHSDYGSEVDARSILALSDYGSDLDVDDIDENTLVGGLLEQIAASAPKTAIYPSIEGQDTLAGEDAAVLVHTPERPALRWAQSSPARRRKALVELDDDVRSQRAFSGMGHRTCTSFDASQTDLLTASSTQGGSAARHPNPHP